MNLTLGVLASGGGSNLQAIIDNVNSGYIPHTSVRIVISNKKDVFALERAKKAGIEAVSLDPKEYNDSLVYNAAVADEFIKRGVNLVCLAGYLLMVKGKLLESYRGRILNIHPALLPKFGGSGMYGHFVHEAVLKANERKSGATIHLVDDKYDHGQIIIQRTVDVAQGDTADSLAKRVLEVEHKIYPEALKLIASGKIKLGSL